ncbi:lectin BRA-3-like [Mugil cephalus]|uniref:lectin BRA-3-like n=1 Tax=Mugil cephalus TaxID=48193 RepID=UPI001FB7999E|nr:lectin BRA-3-like [Mugil cephalus]
MHDQWEWIDKSCSTYRTWSRDRETYNDVILVRYTRGLLETGSGSSYQVICAQGSVRIKVINTTLTWERALEYCKKHHTGLLQIDSEEDQAAVEHWLKHDNTVSDGPLWIGMRRSIIFGFWIWKDGIVTHNNWKNGNQPELPFAHNCGAININDYTWTDEDCGCELPFICEEEI